MLFGKSLIAEATLTISVLIAATVFAIPPAQGQKTATPTSAILTTPDKVDTAIGTLEFRDGAPSAATVQKVYDNLGWFTLLRLYSPKPSFFDKTWRPSEVELVK